MQRKHRHIMAISLAVAGVALMLVAPTNTTVGLAVLACGVLLEVGGRWLERR